MHNPSNVNHANLCQLLPLCLNLTTVLITRERILKAIVNFQPTATIFGLSQSVPFSDMFHCWLFVAQKAGDVLIWILADYLCFTGWTRDCFEADGAEEVQQPRWQTCKPGRLQSAVIKILSHCSDHNCWSLATLITFLRPHCWCCDTLPTPTPPPLQAKRSTITRCCVSLSLKQDNANICHTLGSFLLRLQSNAPRLRHGQRAEPKQPCRAHAMFAMFTTRRRRTLNSLFQWGYIHIHLRAHTQWMPQPWRSR